MGGLVGAAGGLFLPAAPGYDFIMITVVENIPQVTNGPVGLRPFPVHTSIRRVRKIAVLWIYIIVEKIMDESKTLSYM